MSGNASSGQVVDPASQDVVLVKRSERSGSELGIVGVPVDRDSGPVVAADSQLGMKAGVGELTDQRSGRPR